MRYDAKRVRENVRKATTEDLLDRATAYRAWMEPEALEVIDAELHRRGISARDITAREEHLRREGVIPGDGPARRCSFCIRPAVARGRAWHRVWGVLPLFPRTYFYCPDHLAEEEP